MTATQGTSQSVLQKCGISVMHTRVWEARALPPSQKGWCERHLRPLSELGAPEPTQESVMLLSCTLARWWGVSPCFQAGTSWRAGGLVARHFKRVDSVRQLATAGEGSEGREGEVVGCAILRRTNARLLTSLLTHNARGRWHGRRAVVRTGSDNKLPRCAS